MKDDERQISDHTRESQMFEGRVWAMKCSEAETSLKNRMKFSIMSPTMNNDMINGERDMIVIVGSWIRIWSRTCNRCLYLGLGQELSNAPFRAKLKQTILFLQAFNVSPHVQMRFLTQCGDRYIRTPSHAPPRVIEGILVVVFIHTNSSSKDMQRTQFKWKPRPKNDDVVRNQSRRCSRQLASKRAARNKRDVVLLVKQWHALFVKTWMLHVGVADSPPSIYSQAHERLASAHVRHKRIQALYTNHTYIHTYKPCKHTTYFVFRFRFFGPNKMHANKKYILGPNETT